MFRYLPTASLLAALLLLGSTARAIVPWNLSINTNNIVVVTNAVYGALGDGSTDNTLAISNAIVAASRGGVTNGLRGGTVRIPAGTNAYLCGPLLLANNVNLQVDAGAVLRMLPYGAWPGFPYTNSATVPDFITGSSVTNIEVSGFGAIDGQGAPWWPGYKTNNRPVMIQLS
ncbi:MAG TPA: glycosyl hydrolase family 28 protein, partial [Verrucomicrobiae bacterium]